MSPSKSCARCSRPLTAEVGGGLCAACLAAGATADLPADPATRDFEQRLLGPAAPLPETADGPAGDPRSGLPPAPPGYDLLEPLGGGGMGDVFLAREHASERRVAMKFLRSPGNPAAVDRFLVEVRALARLDHPHIVRVFATDFHRASPYYTMEYVTGKTLADRVESEGPLPPRAAAEVVAVVARAVAAAHAADVLHRDIKPRNILLAADGTPKVSDFGLAKRMDRDDGLTNPSGPMGTPGFMPPEQVSSRHGEVGPASDVYGLGATLYHLLTGRPPFVGDTPAEVITKVETTLPDRPRVLRPDIPPGLEAVVVKCLEKRPADRYATATELADDLGRFLTGRTPEAPEQTRRRRLRRWVGRNRWWLTGAAAAVLLGVGLVAAGAAWAPKPVDPPSPPDPLEEIRKELAAGKPVTLIGETGKPLWYDAPTGEIKFGENPTGTGGCYLPVDNLTIVRLLDPPIDNYRLDIELQHVKGDPDRAKATKPSLGLVLGYVRTRCPDDWTEQSFLSVGYNDLARGKPGAPAIPSAVSVESYCYANPPGTLPGSSVWPITQKEFAAGTFFPGPWRKFTAHVSPNRLVLSWSPKSGAEEELADLSLTRLRSERAQHDGLLQILGRDFRRQYTPLPAWSPRQGLGFWAAGAGVAVKNVVITPSDPGGVTHGD